MSKKIHIIQIFESINSINAYVLIYRNDNLEFKTFSYNEFKFLPTVTTLKYSTYLIFSIHICIYVDSRESTKKLHGLNRL